MNDAAADHDELDAGPRQTAPGTRAILRRDRHGAAGRRDDPLRGLARTARRLPISSAGCRAAASGSRRPARRCAPRLPARCSGAASSATSGWRPIWSRRPSGCWSRPRSRRSRSPTRPARSRSGSPRPKPPSTGAGSWPSFMPPRRPRTAPGSSMPPCAGGSSSSAGKVAVIDTFTSAQLDLALGRSNVIHAALLAGRESDTFMARAGLLDRFRTGGRGRWERAKASSEDRKAGTEWLKRRKILATRR